MIGKKVRMRVAQKRDFSYPDELVNDIVRFLPLE